MRATIELNLVPGVLKRIFLSEIVKNDIYLGGESKRNALFFSKNVLQETHPYPQILEKALII